MADVGKIKNEKQHNNTSSRIGGEEEAGSTSSSREGSGYVFGNFWATKAAQLRSKPITQPNKTVTVNPANQKSMK